MKTIALCFNIPELDEGGWRDKQVCKQYPGSGWAPYVGDFFTRNDVKYLVISGSVALAGIASGAYKPGELCVIQEELNETGLKLVKAGAIPWMMFCLESPLFAPFFYDKLREKDPDIFQFKHRLFFGKRGTEPVHFPSFDLDDIQDPDPYFSRKELCAVISNKHYSQYKNMFGHSPSWQMAIQSQLHDMRYQTIEQFIKIGGIDLYGKGWPRGVGQELPAGAKLATIRKYQTSLCGENIVMEGYVTEKLIECLVAGVVPAYIGAPDIGNYVPSTCYLGECTDRLEIIEAGQKFIRSPEGRKYSFQGWAEHILDLFVQDEGNHDRHDERNEPATDNAQA